MVSTRTVFASIVALVLVGACSPPNPQATVELNTVEDSLMYRLHGAVGTVDMWQQMPRYVRFDFRIQFNGDEFLFSENIWDRWEGRYRTRWTAAYQVVKYLES